MTKRTLIIGTRGSDLALWQARRAAAALHALGYPTELKIITTQGDTQNWQAFKDLPGKGFFTKELEDALLKGAIDLAIHSFKDLPTGPPPGLEIAAILDREDPADWLLARPEAWAPENPLGVKPGARVGTSSVRRQAQLRLRQPDIALAELRGNVLTRVRKLRDGLYDAIVLAAAGLRRLDLDLEGLRVRPLAFDEVTPAPAQGALAAEYRFADAAVGAAVAAIRTAAGEVITAERELLRRVQGGCQVPFGFHARRAAGGGFTGQVFWAPPGGRPPRAATITGTDAATLVRAGYAAIFDDAHAGAGRDLGGLHVLLARDAAGNETWARVLRRAGAIVDCVAAIAIQPIPEGIAALLSVPPPADWWVFASAHAIEVLASGCRERGMNPSVLLGISAKTAAVGPATAIALDRAALPVTLTGMGGGAELAQEMVDRWGAALRGARVVVAGARKGRAELARGLEVAGAVVQRAAIYETVPAPGLAVAAVPQGPGIAVFASPSAWRFWAAARPDWNAQGTWKTLAIGAATAAAMTAAGSAPTAVAPEPNLEGVMDALGRMKAGGGS